MEKVNSFVKNKRFWASAVSAVAIAILFFFAGNSSATVKLEEGKVNYEELVSKTEEVKKELDGLNKELEEVSKDLESQEKAFEEAKSIIGERDKAKDELAKLEGNI